MQAIKNFFNTIIQSSTSPKYYQTLIKKPTSFSWKFFFLFYFFASLILIAIPVKEVATFPLEETIKQFVTQAYPPELEVTFTDGQVLINQERPYNINFPSDDLSADDTFLVFESDQNIANLQDVANCPATLIITETSIYSKKSSGEIRAYPIPDLGETVIINQTQVNTWTNDVLSTPWIKNKLYIPILALAMLIGIYLGITFVATIKLLLYSLIGWLIAKLTAKKQKLRLRKVIQISIHSLIPIVIVKYALNGILNLGISGWLYLAIYLVWTLYLISTLPKSKNKKG